MSKELKDGALHALRHFVHSETGKATIQSASTAVATGVAAVAPFAPAVVVAFAPVALFGAAAWGLWKLFGDE